MNRKNPLSLALLAGLTVLAPAVAAEEMPAVPVVAPIMQMPSAPVTARPSASAFGDADFATTDKARVTRILELGQPARQVLSALGERRARQGELGKTLEVGIGRAVQRSNIDLNSLSWQSLADGSRGARFSLTSTKAAALRAGLQLRGNARSGGDPAAVSLRFAGNDGRVFGKSGSDFAKGPLAWSPVVAGDTLTVEIVLAPGQRPDGLSLKVPMLSHLDMDPAAASGRLPPFGTGQGAAMCQRDIACRSVYLQSFKPTSSAVARMVFTMPDGKTGYCTGTLLNNFFVPKKHLFWSAAHCIETQAVADSLQTYWFLEAADCSEDTFINTKYAALSNGAKLLHADTAHDTALLELRQAPPADAVYAAWNSAALTSPGTNIETIHHPQGDRKKYSLGTVTRLKVPKQGHSSLTEVKWDVGAVEEGSSGAGLFTVNANLDYEFRGSAVGVTPMAVCLNNTTPTPEFRAYYSQLSDVWSDVWKFFTPFTLEPGK